MNLNQNQVEKIQQVWNTYIQNGEKFINASREYTNQELDQRRLETIPEVNGWLIRFLEGSVSLEEYKTGIDGINKRNRLWGFQGINGQMFFNILTKNSIAGNRLEEFTDLLKKSLPVPASLNDAKKIIQTFEAFTKDLGKYSADRRGAPKVGSILFFLSYFWQIQQPEKYPVFYTSMVSALADLDIWSPITGGIADDYLTFYNLNYAMINLISKEADRPLHLWDIEHAFWFHGQLQVQQASQGVVASVKTATAKPVEAIEVELPEGYVPPIVAVLPRLAANDEILAEACRRSGRVIEKVFEERLAVIFRMLGFETQLLGQGHGRVPDGIAICQEYRYAIIYDAKVRQNAYTMGTDERAIREYIASQGERLRKQGMRNLYFMVVSSAFTGDHDDAIRSLKIETNVNEVLLVEAKSLLALLEGRLKNPEVDLGPDGIQRLLASSGLLTESEVREFLEI